MRHELEVRRSALFASTPVMGRGEQAVCRRSPLCRDCPYAGHGFLCWGADGTCLRTRMDKINRSEEKTNDPSSFE